jgi:hypothetical protein
MAPQNAGGCARFQNRHQVENNHKTNLGDHMNAKENSATLAGDVSLGGKLSVHRLGFGAMRLTGDGIWGAPKDRKGALAVLRRAVELGINFIDTADSYGPSVSEELIAEALYPYPKDLVIATKGGWNRPGPNQWTHDASSAHLRKAVEGSLKRLRLDRIDVYQLHAPDPVVPLEESVGTLAELQKEGKIRLVGLSNVTREHIERARKIVPIVSVQNRYSFADREWITWWTIVSKIKLRSSHGSRWERAESPAKFWIGSRKPTGARPSRLRWPGCCSAHLLCCRFRERRQLSIWKKMSPQLP